MIDPLPPTGAPSLAGRTPAEAWEPVLDELEREVRKAEGLTASGDAEAASGSGPGPAHGTWAAPEGLPPLPAELAPRVQALETRQRQLIDRLTQQIAANRREHAALNTPGAAAGGYGDAATPAALFCDTSL
jgi:hypothetical protein